MELSETCQVLFNAKLQLPCVGLLLHRSLLSWLHGIDESWQQLLYMLTIPPSQSGWFVSSGLKRLGEQRAPPPQEYGWLSGHEIMAAQLWKLFHNSWKPFRHTICNCAWNLRLPSFLVQPGPTVVPYMTTFSLNRASIHCGQMASRNIAAQKVSLGKGFIVAEGRLRLTPFAKVLENEWMNAKCLAAIIAICISNFGKTWEIAQRMWTNFHCSQQIFFTQLYSSMEIYLLNAVVRTHVRRQSTI